MPYGSYGAIIETVDEHGLKHWHHPKTKKELKDAVANDPASVTIENLSVIGNGPTYIVAADIKPGEFYGTIVGPDPERKRSWYAKIERTSTGKLRVS